MNSGHAVGSRVVVIDTSIAEVSLRPEEIGLQLNWKIGPSSEANSSETYLNLAKTCTGRTSKMFSPTHLRSKQASEALEFSWIRRGRKSSDLWDNEEIPLDASEEKYRVTIFNSDGLAVRTAQVHASGYTYTDAERVEDMGSLTGEFSISVAQLNDSATPGAPASITINPSEI